MSESDWSVRNKKNLKCVLAVCNEPFKIFKSFKMKLTSPRCTSTKIYKATSIYSSWRLMLNSCAITSMKKEANASKHSLNRHNSCTSFSNRYTHKKRCFRIESKRPRNTRWYFSKTLVDLNNKKTSVLWKKLSKATRWCVKLFKI